MENYINPVVLTFLGTVLAALGTFFAAKQQTKSEIETQQLNQEIQRLTSEIHSYQTSNGVYPSIDFFPAVTPDSIPDEISCAVIANGKYPIRIL